MNIIRVIDIETTGLEPPEHSVCEIGWCDLRLRQDLVGGLIADQVIGGGSWLINPGRSIPPEASAIHHLVDTDVSDQPTFAQFWDASREETGAQIVAYAAHSAKFERLWCTDNLTGGAPWICTYKGALRLWPDAPAHNNQCLRYWLQPAGLDRKTAAVAHRAYPDAYVTAHLLRDLLNGGATIEQLIQWTAEPALQTRCQFGKYRGTPWREIDDGFLGWVLTKDFDEDVVHTVRHEIARRKRERAA